MSRDELIALLRSAHDFVPLPETWTGALQRRSVAPGPAPFLIVDCDRCNATGKLRSGWACGDCRGRGRYAVDAYTEQQVDTEGTSWAQLLDDVVNCSTCGGWGRLGAHAESRPDPKTARLCPECEGSGRVPATFSKHLAEGEQTRQRQGDRTLDGLADQHRRRDELRCYRDLAEAMDALKDVEPGTHFLICWIYVLEAQDPSPANAAAIVRGLDFLLARMGDAKAPRLISSQVTNRAAALVRAKGKTADRRAQRARNHEIRRRREEGAKVAELAAEFNLDKAQISRITRSDT